MTSWLIVFAKAVLISVMLLGLADHFNWPILTEAGGNSVVAAQRPPLTAGQFCSH